jgi:hypothetical protein
MTHDTDVKREKNHLVRKRDSSATYCRNDTPETLRQTVCQWAPLFGAVASLTGWCQPFEICLRDSKAKNETTNVELGSPAQNE